MNHGLVWLFPGIEGRSWMLSNVYRAARDEGVRSAIRVYEWPANSGALDNLTAYERNRQEARRVAGEIAEYRRGHANQPVDLAGYSGGGGLAVLVAEALPPDVRVRNVLLAQAALSPDYDLSPALRRMDGELVNFHSDNDWLILGLGTSTFGTIDRKYVQAAGRKGFELDKAVPDPDLRNRVRQCAWRDDMRAYGHDGSHGGMLQYAWNRKFLVPFFKRAAADARVAAGDFAEPASAESGSHDEVQACDSGSPP